MRNIIFLLALVVSFSTANAKETSSQRKGTKYLFVIDKSGSNANSDPGGIRISAIRNLINRAHRPNTQWALAGIGQSNIVYSTVNGEFGFVWGKHQINQSLDKAIEDRDSGATSYMSTLSEVKDLLVREIVDRQDENFRYKIFVVSDGVPTDVLRHREVYGSVKELKQLFLDSNQLQISTIFYGSPNAGAEHLLSEIAELGGGTYGRAMNASDILELLIL